MGPMIRPVSTWSNNAEIASLGDLFQGRKLGRTLGLKLVVN